MAPENMLHTRQVEGAAQAHCVAVTQEHRGHGVSTAIYYLARVLVNEGLRVLIVDLTGRRTRLQSLLARGPVKNLGLWAPGMAQPADLPQLLQQARRQTTGRVDVMLVDVDGAPLERAGGLAAGIDHILLVTQASPSGQASAERLAHRLDNEPAHGRVGVVFSRVDAPSAASLPERTEDDHLPVLGYYPADYLLANGDEYSLKGSDPSWPHDNYLYALLRLGRLLMRTVPLHRLSLGQVSVRGTPPYAHEEHDARPAL